MPNLLLIPMPTSNPQSSCSLSLCTRVRSHRRNEKSVAMDRCGWFRRAGVTCFRPLPKFLSPELLVLKSFLATIPPRRPLAANPEQPKARIIQQQHQQHVPRLKQVTAEQPSRLVIEPEQPLQSHPAGPTRRNWHRPGQIVECRPVRRQDHTYIQPRVILMRPELLPRHAHANQQQIWPVSIDLFDQRL